MIFEVGHFMSGAFCRPGVRPALKSFLFVCRKSCYYCGKQSNPPHHYNGLDRLDSTIRVYTTATCVSCCGTCNMCKYRFTEEQFLEQCIKVCLRDYR